MNQFRSQLDSEVRSQFDLTAAYVLAGRACAARVKEWCWIDGSPPLAQVQFFFERGDGKEIQSALYRPLEEDGYPTPQFKSKRNRYSKSKELIEYGLIPFQAADVLAYLFRLNAKYEGQDWRDKESIRWMLDELSSVPESSVSVNTNLPGLNIYLRAACVNLLGGDEAVSP